MYPHVTQFQTVDLRASLAAGQARPKRVRERKVMNLVHRRSTANGTASA